MKLRPCNDWILVKCDPFDKEVRGIVIPDTAHLQRVRTATVKKIGPGRWQDGQRVPTGLEEGDRVAFFRENQEHLQGKQIGAILKELGDDLALIRLPDVLLTWKAGDKVQVE